MKLKDYKDKKPKKTMQDLASQFGVNYTTMRDWVINRNATVSGKNGEKVIILHREVAWEVATEKGDG